MSSTKEEPGAALIWTAAKELLSGSTISRVSEATLSQTAAQNLLPVFLTS